MGISQSLHLSLSLYDGKSNAYRSIAKPDIRFVDHLEFHSNIFPRRVLSCDGPPSIDHLIQLCPAVFDFLSSIIPVFDPSFLPDMGFSFSFCSFNLPLLTGLSSRSFIQGSFADRFFLSLVSISSRMARRGGVKRIQASIYDEIRAAISARLSLVSHPTCFPRTKKELTGLINV